MNNLILQTEGLTKQYRRRIAVNAVSLAVARGDIYGFLGQNGAGKSTLLKIITGEVLLVDGGLGM